MDVSHNDVICRERIRTYLIQRANAVHIDAHQNLSSLTVMTEDFYVEFLNILLGLSLKNGNDDMRNVPGIDLIDSVNNVVAQVSATCDQKKVQDSIDRFHKPDGDWHFYFIPIIEKAPKYRSDFKLPAGLTFDRTRDVLDITRIMELAKGIDKLRDLYLLVEKYSNAENLKAKQHQGNLREKLNKLLLETWKHHRSFKLMETDEIDRRLFPGIQDSHQFEALGKRKDDETDSPVWTIIRESWKEPENHPIMIEGGGGIGKTVTLFSLTNMDKDMIPAPAVYVPMFDLIDQDGKVVDLSDFFMSSNSLSPLKAEERKELCTLSEKSWDNGPSLLVLLDGFNEVEGTRRWDVLRMLRNWHKTNPGAQLISVSRPLDNLNLKTSFGEETISVVLSALTKESVTAYLKGLQGEGIRLPDPNSPIWGTIVYPLFLNLYIKADCLRNQQAWKDYPLCVRETAGPGSIIWNYLQRELLRNEDELWILRCAIACEYLAPILANHMMQRYDYTISLKEAVEVIEKAVAQMDLDLMPAHLTELISWWKTQELSAEPPRFLKALNWPDIVLRESGLLVSYRGRSTGKAGYKIEPRFEFLHQNFRDCLAGLFLVNESEMSSEDTVPIPWRNRQSYLALNYASELIDSEVLDRLWEANRKSPQYKKARNTRNHTATRNLLELYRRNEKLAKSLDFSGMDLRSLSLTNYLGNNREPLPLFQNSAYSIDTAFDRETFQSNGHTGIIGVLAVLPDGHVVSGSYDDTLRVWDAVTGQCLQTLGRHSDSVYCVAVLPNGRVVSGSRDRSLRVWDAATGQCLQTLEGRSGEIFCVAVLPDGRVVSGSSDHTLRVWDIATGKSLQTLKGHTYPVNCVAVLSDSRVVSGSDDSTLRVWDTASGKCLQVLKGHSDSVTCVAILPDGRVVSGSRDRSLRVWDAATGQCLQTLEGHRGSVNCVAVLPDGRVVSGSDDSTLRVWDAATGQCLQTLEERSGEIFCVTVLPGGRVVSGSRYSSLRVWDVATGYCLQTFERQHRFTANCIAVLPHGRVVSGSYDSTLRVWDAATGQCLQTMEGHSREIYCVAVLPNGRVVSGSYDSTLRVWDAATGQCLQTLEGHSGEIYCVVVLPDGRVVSGSDDSTLRVWDTASGKCLQVLKGHSDSVTCVAILPDGRVVSGSYDSTLRVWDSATGQCLKTLRGHSFCVTSVTVFPDGRVVSSSYDSTLRVWDTNTGQCLQTLEGHSGEIYCVVVLPDGRVVSGSKDGILRVWDAATGQCLQTLKGHSNGIRCVAVLSDSRVVSGSYDSTLRVWDTNTGQCLQTLEGHSEEIYCVVVLPDGRVVSGSKDGILRVWDAYSGNCLDMLEAMEVPVSGMDFSLAEITEELAGLLYHNGAIISERDYLRWAEANHIRVDKAPH